MSNDKLTELENALLRARWSGDLISAAHLTALIGRAEKKIKLTNGS